MVVCSIYSRIAQLCVNWGHVARGVMTGGMSPRQLGQDQGSVYAWYTYHKLALIILMYKRFDVLIWLSLEKVLKCFNDVVLWMSRQKNICHFCFIDKLQPKSIVAVILMNSHSNLQTTSKVNQNPKLIHWTPQHMVHITSPLIYAVNIILVPILNSLKSYPSVLLLIFMVLFYSILKSQVIFLILTHN